MLMSFGRGGYRSFRNGGTPRLSLYAVVSPHGTAHGATSRSRKSQNPHPYESKGAAPKVRLLATRRAVAHRIVGVEMSDHFALMMSGMVNTRTLGKPKVEGCGPKNLSTGRPIGHPPPKVRLLATRQRQPRRNSFPRPGCRRRKRRCLCRTTKICRSDDRTDHSGTTRFRLSREESHL